MLPFIALGSPCDRT